MFFFSNTDNGVCDLWRTTVFKTSGQPGAKGALPAWTWWRVSCLWQVLLGKDLSSPFKTLVSWHKANVKCRAVIKPFSAKTKLRETAICGRPIKVFESVGLTQERHTCTSEERVDIFWGHVTGLLRAVPLRM